MAERADLARVYRAIGNSQAPMPIDVDIWTAHDHLDLRLPDNSIQEVNVWAKALRVKTQRGGTTVSASREFHSYASVRTEWLGWKVQVKSFIDGPSPDDRPRTPKAVLGTGDEPADEAIVSGGNCDESVPQAGYDCHCAGDLPHPEQGMQPGAAASAHERDDVPPNAGSAS